MNLINRFFRRATLCAGALSLCFSLSAGADEIQDINKLFKQKEYAPALERVNTYLADKPKDARARFLKGLILTEQGHSADAISVFTALTVDYPELPEPYNNLAVLYAGKGEYDKARIALEKAIRTHPSYTTAHENLGDIYAKLASQAYDRALQLDRSNTGTQTKLAMIQDLFTGDATRNAATSTVSLAKPKAAAPAPVAALVVAPVVVAAAAPAPASAIVAGATGPAVARNSADDTGRALKTVDDWAAAWSSQNVDAYLALYAADFKTPGGESRTAWAATRRERVSRPELIKVSISNANVSIRDDSHATVTFRQSYRANHLQTLSRKTLLLVKTDGKWLIQEERSGK